MLTNSFFRQNRLLILIIFLASILRLYNLGKQSVWLDEAYSATMSSDLGALWSEQAKDPSPPLYYSMLHFWTFCFGKSEFYLRLLSALFGILFIPLVFVAGMNIFNRKAGLFAALLAALSPYHIYYSQEARAYSLLAFLSLASFLMLYLSIRGNRRIFWAAYVLITIFCLYTHNYGALLLIAELFFCIFCHPQGRVLLNTIISFLCILIAFLPRIPVLSIQAAMDMNPWIHAAKISDLISTFKYFCLLSWRLPATSLLSLVLKIAIPVFAVIFVSGLLNRKKGNIFLVTYFFIPLGIAFLISLKKPVYVAGRYDILVFPAFCLIMGIGLSKIKAYFLRRFLLLSIIMVTSLSLFHYYFIYRKSNDRCIAKYVQKYSDEKDIIVATELSITPFGYYWEKDFQPRLFQFPAGPRAALVKEALIGEKEYVSSEIRKLTEKIYPLLNRGNKLWILYRPFIFSDKLIETLEKELENTESINFPEGDNLNQVSRVYVFKKR